MRVYKSLLLALVVSLLCVPMTFAIVICNKHKKTHCAPPPSSGSHHSHCSITHPSKCPVYSPDGIVATSQSLGFSIDTQQPTCYRVEHDVYYSGQQIDAMVEHHGGTFRFADLVRVAPSNCNN